MREVNDRVAKNLKYLIYDKRNGTSTKSINGRSSMRPDLRERKMNLYDNFEEEIQEVTLDGDWIRRDLMDYYGTAMASGFPMAVVDLGRVQRASGDELLAMARQAGLDLNKYIIG